MYIKLWKKSEVLNALFSLKLHTKAQQLIDLDIVPEDILITILVVWINYYS